MVSRPLAVAGTATVLLLAILAADVAMNRTYSVDLRAGEAWRTIAEQPYRHSDTSRPSVVFGGLTLPLNRSDSAELRLRVDNGHAWGFSDTFRVYLAGAEVASGPLTAPARGEGEAIFRIPATTLWGAGIVSPRGAPVATPADPKAVSTSINLEILVGGERIWAYFTILEVEKS